MDLVQVEQSAQTLLESLVQAAGLSRAIGLDQI
jgi:hypothetical protein